MGDTPQQGQKPNARHHRVPCSLYQVLGTKRGRIVTMQGSHATCPSVELNHGPRKKAVDHHDVPSRTIFSGLPRASRLAELVLCMQFEPRRADSSSLDESSSIILALEGGSNVAGTLGTQQPRGRRPFRDATNSGDSPSTPASAPLIRRWELTSTYSRTILAPI
ncbi:hypothetical protein BHE74_00040888 [Ensete ventricosum]|nr:hypothetical protein BHE74_00040888 [Ensete ventricosum]RZS16249.1 hypothetical protein BHM03_00048214 [Ensete ventricosum]